MTIHKNLSVNHNYIYIYIYIKKVKLRFWTLSYILYFNLIPIILIVSIWSLIFQYRVNLVIVFIFWMKINDVFNDQN